MEGMKDVKSRPLEERKPQVRKGGGQGAGDRPVWVGVGLQGGGLCPEGPAQPSVQLHVAFSSPDDFFLFNKRIK